MKYGYILAFVLFFSSCTKEESSSVCKTGPVQVSVSLSASKVTGYTDRYENILNDVTFYVFKNDGRLDAMAKVDKASIDGSELIRFASTTGPKTIVAVANMPESAGDISVSSLDGLDAVVCPLDGQMPDRLVMTGRTTVDLAAGLNRVSVEVERLVSSVAVHSFRTDFRDAAYRKDGVLTLKAVYLLNARSSIRLDGGPTQDWEGTEGPQCDNRLLYEGGRNYVLSGAEGVVDFGEDPLRLYCYPNDEGYHFSPEGSWSPRATMLVFECTLNTVSPARTMYYSVPLMNMGPNTKYDVNVTVTSPGSRYAGQSTLQEGYDSII